MEKEHGEGPGSAWDAVGGTIPSSSLATALKALQRHAPPDGPGERLRVVTWDGHLDLPLLCWGAQPKAEASEA